MAKVNLHDLVRHPKVWRGAAIEQHFPSLSTGYEDLDNRLPGGGWPIQAMIEIFVADYGVGEMSLLMPALVSLETQPIVWCAPPYLPYAPALARCGLDLQHLLFINANGTERNALWALEQVLRWRSKVTVLAWVETVSTVALRRLQLGIEESGSWVILFRPNKALRQKSPSALRLRISRKAYRAQIEILKCRGGRPSVFDIDLPIYASDERAASAGGVG